MTNPYTTKNPHKRRVSALAVPLAGVPLDGLPQCLDCIHNNGFGICEAFPDGIPFEITQNRHDHKAPFQGDNGILFQGKGGKL